MRQRFKCSLCGLGIEGKMWRDGSIKASDRGPTDYSIEVQPCVCVNCQQNAPACITGVTGCECRPCRARVSS